MEQEIQAISQMQNDDDDCIIDLFEKQDQMDEKLSFLSGVVARQEQIIGSLNNKIKEYQRRSMNNKLIVTCIPYHKEENCIMESQNFFRANMRLTQDLPTCSVRRMGRGEGKAMLVELEHSSEKGMVYRSVYRLKDERNAEKC